MQEVEEAPNIARLRFRTDSDIDIQGGQLFYSRRLAV